MFRTAERTWYKRQRLERDEQNMMGAAALRRFLVPVQIPPQNSGQDTRFPIPHQTTMKYLRLKFPQFNLITQAAIYSLCTTVIINLVSWITFIRTFLFCLFINYLKVFCGGGTLPRYATALGQGIPTVRDRHISIRDISIHNNSICDNSIQSVPKIKTMCKSVN